MKKEIREFIRINKGIENPSVGNGCETNRPKTASKKHIRYYHNQATLDRLCENPKEFHKRRNEARKAQAENSRIKFETRMFNLVG